MPISIEGIKFNYAPHDLAQTGAINLRRNEKDPVAIPEWNPKCVTHECSPVAYRIKSVPKQMRIEVSFLVDGPVKLPLKIRGFPEPKDHILGQTAEIDLTASGSSGFMSVLLPAAKIRSKAVGVYDVAWRWQYSLSSGNGQPVWTDFQTSRHRVYSILTAPTKPWEWDSTNPKNIHLPWTEVLDYACAWASGVGVGGSGSMKPQDEAAVKIAKAVYDLGRSLVRYHPKASYAKKRFACGKFLKLLKNGIGGAQTLNCDDCATILSTFANIVGCDLFQSSIGYHFKTNQIRPLGMDWFADTFIHHGVAWKNECLTKDALFDCCFQVDGDGSPDRPPPQPLLAANMIFGATRDKAYEFCLVNSKSNADPIPDDPEFGRQRRQFGSTLGDGVAIIEAPLLNLLKERYGFESWPRVEANNNASLESVREWLDMDRSFLGWALHSLDWHAGDTFETVLEAILRGSDDRTQRLLEITVYKPNASTDPNLALLHLLGEWDVANLERLESPQIGNLAFTSPDGSVVHFRRGRVLAVVRSAGRRVLSVLESAAALDQLILNSTIWQTTPKRRNKMEHILADLQTAQMVDFSGGSGSPRGRLDIRTIDESGTLEEGYHFDAAGRVHPIRGEAYMYKDKLFFEFTHKEGTGKFLGMLVLNDLNGDRLVVSGVFGVPGRKEQDEEPWVITKP